MFQIRINNNNNVNSKYDIYDKFQKFYNIIKNIYKRLF